MLKDIRFLVKFGKREHLEDIIKGEIYFTNAKRLIEIESIKMRKGQGDSGEGRTKIAFNSARLYNTATGKLEREITDNILDLGYQYVPDIPVFCLTAVYEKDMTRNTDGTVTINISDNIKKNIKSSFDEADAALIIKAPQIFDKDIRSYFNNLCESDVMKYYKNMSKGVITIEMIEYIAGSYKNLNLSEKDYLVKLTTSISNSTYYFTLQNLHRILFCKDAEYFKDQQEYRFVAYQYSIDKPQKLPIKTSAEMEIVDIDNVFTGYNCFVSNV